MARADRRQGLGPQAELDKFAIEPVLINENIGQQ